MLLIFCITAKLLPFQRMTKSKGRKRKAAVGDVNGLLLCVLISFGLLNFFDVIDVIVNIF